MISIAAPHPEAEFVANFADAARLSCLQMHIHACGNMKRLAMEIVLIGIVVALFWAFLRESSGADRPRRSYATRHVLGPLPDEGRTICRKNVRNGQPEQGTPAPAGRDEIDDLFDDDWFPLYGSGLHPGGLNYVDRYDPIDPVPASWVNPLYVDDWNDPFGRHYHGDHDGHNHHEWFDDP